MSCIERVLLHMRNGPFDTTLAVKDALERGNVPDYTRSVGVERPDVNPTAGSNELLISFPLT